LDDYGGATRTHYLSAHSPAINRGSNGLKRQLTDQRGFSRHDSINSLDIYEGSFARTVDSVPDLGAVEAALIVTISDDEEDGNYSFNDLSLREAINLASDEEGGVFPDWFNLIQFSPHLATSTITLDSTLGPLVIDTPVIIQGLGADQLTISGNDEQRVFLIDEGAQATILDLTITDGYAVDSGGGVLSRGRLTLERVHVVGNFAHRGGGISQESGDFPFLFIYDSTVADNVGFDAGGGLYFTWGNVEIFSSTFSGNSAAVGGGIYIESGNAAFNMENSTVSGNIGEGIRAVDAGLFGILASTVAYNSESTVLSANDSAGGVNVVNTPAVLLSTIVASNSGGDINGSFYEPDPFIPFAGSNYNLIGDGSEANLTTSAQNIVGTSANSIDPRLAPLDYYGGVTQTHALYSYSPAINAGESLLLNFFYATDQRGPGYDRINDGGSGLFSDIGSYEYNPGSAAASGGSGSMFALREGSHPSERHLTQTIPDRLDSESHSTTRAIHIANSLSDIPVTVWNSVNLELNHSRRLGMTHSPIKAEILAAQSVATLAIQNRREHSVRGTTSHQRCRVIAWPRWKQMLTPLLPTIMMNLTSMSAPASTSARSSWRSTKFIPGEKVTVWLCRKVGIVRES
jgi:hypothetical protein